MRMCLRFCPRGLPPMSVPATLLPMFLFPSNAHSCAIQHASVYDHSAEDETATPTMLLGVWRPQNNLLNFNFATTTLVSASLNTPALHGMMSLLAIVWSLGTMCSLVVAHRSCHHCSACFGFNCDAKFSSGCSLVGIALLPPVFVWQWDQFCRELLCLFVRHGQVQICISLPSLQLCIVL